MQYAIVFPGQGSQSCGMLADCFRERSRFSETFEQASTVLGYDVKQLVLEGPAETLNTTTFTQPVLLTAEYALWREWQAIAPVAPAFLAGHSLGEYTALVAGEALSFEEALRLVATRARLMQSAVPVGQGAMAAVLGLENDIIEEICRSVEQETKAVVSPANFNTIGQTVIAGEAGAVEKASEKLKAAGAKKIVPLPVSVPSHCALMDSIRDEFTLAVHQCTWKTPLIPIVQNATVALADSVSSLQVALIDQLSRPVRWVESMQWLAEKGVTNVLECGPNKVLQGLTKRIDARMTASGFQSPLEMQTILAEIF